MSVFVVEVVVVVAEEGEGMIVGNFDELAGIGSGVSAFLKVDRGSQALRLSSPANGQKSVFTIGFSDDTHRRHESKLDGVIEGQDSFAFGLSHGYHRRSGFDQQLHRLLDRVLTDQESQRYSMMQGTRKR